MGIIPMANQTITVSQTAMLIVIPTVIQTVILIATLTVTLTPTVIQTVILKPSQHTVLHIPAVSELPEKWLLNLQ